MPTILHPSLAAYLAAELISAKRAGKSFQKQELEDFLAVLIEHWNQNTPQTAIPAPLEAQLSPSEAIYAAYPRRVGKTAAIKAIKKALQQIKDDCLISSGQTPESFLLERTKQYALAVSKWSSRDRQFIPMTTTWFNQGRYLDDPSEWQRQHASSVGPTARDYTKL